ncbi:hypothetical protein ONS95_003943 [Cadophora gregata]|uniref:uncharacterized protein n=1 Tax=Cadophora gregata TaxID=51156 RepID=UPI0026DB3B3F|nr:uncharacterized protein ONS95_003943 [Cadophora gregata]KAK0107241.1 hypothetical protein ONS95_003943 [Cadophora gregata]
MLHLSNMFSSHYPTHELQHVRQAGSEPENFFTLFRHLPTELQITIFELSMPGPRIVDFRHLAWADDNENWSFCKHYERLRPRLGIPPLLHTCRLSREIALKSYSLFQSEDGTLPFGYFNFELDTLSLTQRSMSDPQDLDWNIVLEAFGKLVKEEDRRKIRRLQARLYPFSTATSLTEGILSTFPDLKIITVRFDRVRPFIVEEGSMNPLAVCWTPIKPRSADGVRKGWKIECLLMPE